MSEVHSSFREERSNYLRHFPSTPHLFLESSSMKGSSHHRSFNHVLTTASSNNLNIMTNSYMPKTGFSTFKKPKPKPPPKSSSMSFKREKCQFQDDPNPYKVSRIDEYNKIKVNDPFLPKKSCAAVNRKTSQIFSFEERDGLVEAFDQLELNRRAQNLYEEQCRSMTIGYKVPEPNCRGHHRPSALNTSTGKVNFGRSSLIIPEPDYEPEPEPEPYQSHPPPIIHRRGGDECERRGGGSIGRPMLDSSCSSSEGYSSVCAATSSSSCSASDPDPYAVPNVGRASSRSSPDEGLILEANDNEKSSRISPQDRVKIQFALMGRKTSIFVADCLANLYCMRKSNFLTSGGYSVDGEWELKYTGVPVLLLDLGETKSRDKRRIQIVLAELGTGLALWKDVIDNLTSYKVMEGSHAFHSMHLSTDHTTIIGLSFDDEECAENFAQKVESLTSDFANISLSGAKSKLKKSKSSLKSKFIKPKKSEISQPCSFNHVSTLSLNDKRRFPSLQNFVVPVGGGLKSLDQAAVSTTDFVSLSKLACGSELHF